MFIKNQFLTDHKVVEISRYLRSGGYIARAENGELYSHKHKQNMFQPCFFNCDSLKKEFNNMGRKIEKLQKSLVCEEDKKELQDLWREIVLERITNHSAKKTIIFNAFWQQIATYEKNVKSSNNQPLNCTY